MRKGVLLTIAALLLMSGCSESSSAPAKEQDSAASHTLQLDSKHAALPDYVKKASPMVQETYMMAAKDPAALSAVPCYCGCFDTDGHTSNMNCFIKKIGPNNEVTEWDPMGTG